MSALAFTADDGVEVSYRRWLPDGAVRGVLLIVHGASEHSGRYARFADVIRAEGWAVYALDLRGHGRTADSTGRGRLGAGGGDGVLADVDRLAALARAEFPSRPVVLFGHSMGSLIALAYVERFGDLLAGWVLSGGAGVSEHAPEISAMVRDALSAGRGSEVPEAFGGFNAGFEPARTAYDWLSRDADEVDKYVADPWCGDGTRLTYEFVAGMLELASSTDAEALAHIPKHLPVLLLTGEADPVSNGAEQVRALEQRLRDAGLDITARYYEDARHELLNELNRDEVHADVIAWLDRVMVAG